MYLTSQNHFSTLSPWLYPWELYHILTFNNPDVSNNSFVSWSVSLKPGSETTCEMRMPFAAIVNILNDNTVLFAACQNVCQDLIISMQLVSFTLRNAHPVSNQYSTFFSSLIGEKNAIIQPGRPENLPYLMSVSLPPSYPASSPSSCSHISPNMRPYSWFPSKLASHASRHSLSLFTLMYVARSLLPSFTHCHVSSRLKHNEPVVCETMRRRSEYSCLMIKQLDKGRQVPACMQTSAKTTNTIKTKINVYPCTECPLILHSAFTVYIFSVEIHWT